MRELTTWNALRRAASSSRERPSATDGRLANGREAGGRPLEVRRTACSAGSTAPTRPSRSTGRRSPASTSTYCKGCEICAEVCPTDAVTMVPEEVES